MHTNLLVFIMVVICPAAFLVTLLRLTTDVVTLEGFGPRASESDIVRDSGIDAIMERGCL